MEIKIQQETCVTESCGVAFWIDEKLQQRLVETKRNFYCPNGHAMHYLGETDKVKLIRVQNEKRTLELEKNAEIERLKKQLRTKCRKPRKSKKS